MNNLSVSNGSKNGLFAKPTIGRSEYGRVKVALAPGKGFMDWLRITANKHLAKRVNGGVDHVELMKHNTRDDCWVHLFGMVYDVTQYLDFHPGGIPELLRGAGRDATPLFNQYHAWVNYQSFLKACVVGPFIGDLSKLPPPLPPTTSDDVNKLGVPSSMGSLFSSDSSENGFGSRVEPIGQNGVSFEHDDWTRLTENNVVVSLTPFLVKTSINTRGEENSEEHARLRILIHHFWKPAMEFEFEPAAELFHQKFDLKIVKNRVEIRFSHTEMDLTTVLSREKCKIQRRPGVSYHSTRISEITEINHDTLLFGLEIPENTSYRIALGHHVSVKVRKGNAVLYRPYTPITDSENPRHLNLMIKVYSDGICTPSLSKLKIGDELEISDPIGEKDFREWTENSSELIVLAAGSGITPMVDILERRKTKTILLIFNKSEKDIPTKVAWKLEELLKHPRVTWKNVLSAPESENSDEYLYGRISVEMLKPLISTSSDSEDSKTSRRAFICGPDGFNLAAKSALESLGVLPDHMHIFQG